MSNENRFLTTKEAAHYLGVPVRTLRESLMRQEDFPKPTKWKAVRGYRWQVSSLDAWVDKKLGETK